MKNTTLRDLRTTLIRYPSELARGATRHAALQPYPDGEAVLAALALDSALSPPERDALVRASTRKSSRSWPDFARRAVFPWRGHTWSCWLWCESARAERRWRGRSSSRT